MKSFQFSEPASAELAAAVAWYEQQRSGLGRELFDALVETIDRFEPILRSAPLDLPAGRVANFA